MIKPLEIGFVHHSSVLEPQDGSEREAAVARGRGVEGVRWRDTASLTGEQVPESCVLLDANLQLVAKPPGKVQKN